VKILKAEFKEGLAGAQAPAGKTYLALALDWENIHPKQKIEKTSSRKSRTGPWECGGVAGGKAKSAEEFVDVDVA
jgi:hypothetical protein